MTSGTWSRPHAFLHYKVRDTCCRELPVSQIKQLKLRVWLASLILWSYSVVVVLVQRPDWDTTVVSVQSNKLLPNIFDLVVLPEKFDVFVDGDFSRLPAFVVPISLGVTEKESKH